MASKAENEEYVLKNDEEMRRLSSQHPVLKAAIGGSLLLPPISLSSGSRILDSGTADGFWLQDLAATLGSNNEYFGTDIDPEVFPKNPPANFHYFVQDINAPWPAEYENSFDLVHQRLTLVAAGPNVIGASTALTKLVKSGGWIEMIEAEQTHDPDDGPAMQQFIKMMHDFLKTIGGKPQYAADIRKAVEHAGFVDVHEKVFDMHLGPKNSEPKLGQLGINSTCTATEGLIQHIKNMPEGTCSLSHAELDTLPQRLRTELEEQGSNYPMRVLWARKP